MPKQEYEFTLILSGIPKLTREVMDSLYQAGCDDALIGTRDGVAFADFYRRANSFRQAVLSAIRDVEASGVGAKVEHVEPDELVTMSEIARRLHLSREGVRKWVAGMRGPGNFPTPAGSLTQRSPVWRWTDVIQWHQRNLRKGQLAYGDLLKGNYEGKYWESAFTHVAAFNAALDLRRCVPLEEAIKLLQTIVSYDKMAGSEFS